MVIIVGSKRGNMLFIAFGILVILSFLGVAFVLLARQAENLAVSGKDRISTNFAAYSGLQYTIARLTEEFLKYGQFTKNSKLFFKGEDQQWNFEFNEENDVNKNSFLDTFNLPVEIAKNVSIEESIVSEGDKNLFFRVKIVDESAKFPINDDLKLTMRILDNISKCLNLDLEIETKNFLNFRSSGKLIEDKKTFLDIFGEKKGNFLLQFFTFTPKLFSTTLYYITDVHYDGEKIYSITQFVPRKEKIKMGKKPFLNINSAPKPTICANFVNLDAFYLKIEKYSPSKVVNRERVNRNFTGNVNDLWHFATARYVRLDKQDFDKFYANFVNNTKKKLFRTYKEFFEFVFSKSGIEKIKSELIWVNANPNIDILKFNDIWNYMYVKEDTPKFVHREIDKFDLVLPTYEIAFNSSGLFSVEVEGRYQYKNIIIAKHKLNAIVDLIDYIIDTTQEDFLSGVFEKAATSTKNGLTLITYPEYAYNEAKNNIIDGQIGLSFNSYDGDDTCSLLFDNMLMLHTKDNKKLKVKEKFSSYLKDYRSVFDIQDTYGVVVAGLIVDGIKTLELPLDSCINKFNAKYAELPENEILSIYKKKEYPAFHIGLSMWIKPSYYSNFVFPLLATFSEKQGYTFSIFKFKNDDIFQIMTKEFVSPLISVATKRFFGCIGNRPDEMMLLPNRWFHLAASIELKSCALYYNSLSDKKMSDTDRLKWFLGRCPYYTLYINGRQIDHISKDKSITVEQFFDSRDISEFSSLFIGDMGVTNSFFTIDNIRFFERYELLKDILNTTNKGRYYNQDTVFTSRSFTNKDDYLYLLTSEVITLPIDNKFDSMLCIKFSDVTGSTQCYGDLLETPFARWNVSFVGRIFNYLIVWKNLSSCGSNTSPIVDSVILTMIKKPTIKLIAEDVR